jgi:glycosyltransferase involved in cell wall biosynthesis
MKIGLNLLYLLPGEVGGTESYALSLIHALSQADHENIYYIYLNHESISIDLPNSDNFILVHCKVSASNRFYRFLWEQFILPIQALFHRLDILHSLGYISPIFLSCASVVTIHDLNYLAIPQAFTLFTRLVQQVFVTISVRHANQIIAVSEFTKNEIIKFLSAPENKISVTHEAPKIRNALYPSSKGNQVNILNEFGICIPFILALSSLAPHKNTGRLIDAFERANAALDNSWMLVIAGHLPTRGLKTDCCFQRGSQTSKIVTTGYLPDAQIVQLFNNADLFVFPSLYEGFGIPMLEAMQWGVPVACSNRGSLPEIADGAVEFFDPIDISDIAEVIKKLMANSARRDKLRRLGHDRVKRFSWEKTAEKTLEVYQLAYDRIASLQVQT